MGHPMAITRMCLLPLVATRTAATRQRPMLFNNLALPVRVGNFSWAILHLAVAAEMFTMHEICNVPARGLILLLIQSISKQ